MIAYPYSIPIQKKWWGGNVFLAATGYRYNLELDLLEYEKIDMEKWDVTAWYMIPLLTCTYGSVNLSLVFYLSYAIFDGKVPVSLRLGEQGLASGREHSPHDPLLALEGRR